MGIESLALDAEGEYGVVAESLGGINVVISPTSKTVINLFDIETENVKDEITGKERTIVSVENKVEDVTQGLLTMARAFVQPSCSIPTTSFQSSLPVNTPCVLEMS